MQKVKNKKCIRNLSAKSLKAAKARNTIAVLAIALTAMLFTAVFTIAMSMKQSYQEQNFRQAGGTFHGTFKNVTEEEIEELKEHPLIRQAGARLMLGIPAQAPFLKNPVEVSYVDQVCADAMFCKPQKGDYPKEGTMEAATDTRVLKLLGVKPEIGTEFTLTFDLGSGTTHPQSVTQTFILSGYWEYDPAARTSFVNVPLSYARKVLESYQPQAKGDITGQWDLYVHFKNSLHIENDLNEVLKDKGYQSGDDTADNYIAVGVNWSYVSAQLVSNMDMGTIAGIAAAVLLIVFTGYLIIYNIFRISVTGDIRFYGLLKTIGTTGKQIRRMIRRQAGLLSCIGIPIGLIAGWLIGAVVTPVIMKLMLHESSVQSVSPWIFAAAAVFSYLTVLLSCWKPARMAAKVSPVEAVRYTESTVRRKRKKGEKGARVTRMALANLGRSKSKTMLVIISLSLAVVLMNITLMFAKGFDMDKYLKQFVSADYVVGHTDYFNSRFRRVQQAVPEDIIADIESQGGMKDGGRTYGLVTHVNEYMTEEQLRHILKQQPNGQALDQRVDELRESCDEEGLFPYSAGLYGMEALPMSKLEVTEGDLSRMKAGGDYIAAVIQTDDYGKEIPGEQHCNVGDSLKLRYVDEYMYVDSRTGEEAEDSTPDEYVEFKVLKSHEKTYTVCAKVELRRTMSYRRYGNEEFILPAEEFKIQTNSSAVMNYLFDMKDRKSDQAMNAFLKNYTDTVQTDFNFESKQTYESQFYGFRNVFLLMGGLLSFVIGMIGLLNFINAVTTSVISRKREFAVLQAVGMTGKQLKQMLVLEGLLYGVGGVLLALLLYLVLAPVISGVLSGMFWFFTPHFTVLAIWVIIPVFLLLGICIPVLAYRSISRQSLVDRIREA